MGLTGAERQARWRAKRDAEIAQLRKAAGGDTVPAPSPESGTDSAARIARELIGARKEIAALRKQLDAATKPVPLAPGNDLIRQGDDAALPDDGLMLAGRPNWMRWYSGNYNLTEYDCFYSDPGCGDDCYCIEPPLRPKRGGVAYVIRDRNDVVIDEAYTLIEAMALAQEHADDNPQDEETRP